MQHGRARGQAIDEGAEEHPLAGAEAGGGEPARLLCRGVDAEGPLAQVELRVHVVVGRDRPNHHISHEPPPYGQTHPR